VTSDDPDCAEFADTCWASSDFNSRSTCGARVQQFKRRNWDFYEIERFVDFTEGAGDWCPREMSYAIIMRDPIKRAASQMTANQQTIDDIRGWFRTPTVFRHRSGYIRSHIPYDNFFVRTLCGLDCFFLPPDALDGEHLETAKRQLAKFDAVLTADNLLTQLVQLEALTGWRGLQASATRVVHNNGCAKGGPQCARFAMSQADVRFLQEHNRLDLKLYDYAAEVAREKTTRLNHLALHTSIGEDALQVRRELHHRNP